jgi:D-aminopeptidase
LSESDARRSTAPKPRARDLGVPFDGEPGPLNALTDVPGVAVGHVTLIRGSPPGAVGQGPVRTGVTAILPRGARAPTAVFGAWFSLNGNGELTGTAWLEESGFVQGPVVFTNTVSVGVAHSALADWMLRTQPEDLVSWHLPVVGETWDGYLNDIAGNHVTREDVVRAIETARAGPVPEGNVGGGTGMVCYGFKGGIGTASRRVEVGGTIHTLGVLVQANHGRTSQLRVGGLPVGAELKARRPTRPRDGSILILAATDAPLLPHQLKRIARRASLGLARTGATSSNQSGDLFLAFSTANEAAGRGEKRAQVEMLPNHEIDPLFDATVSATEEAIVNALFAAETMDGFAGHRVEALPVEAVVEALRTRGLLAAKSGY